MRLGILWVIAGTSALAQDARDIARDMGADTTTSVSAGTDRNGIHRDTETIRGARDRQHAPDLIDSVQGSKPTSAKADKVEKSRLLQKRNKLLEERKASAQEAVTAARTAESQKEGTTNPSFVKSKSAQVDETGVRKQAERAWDAKHDKELRDVDRKKKKSSSKGGEVRLHAPSLVSPN